MSERRTTPRVGECIRLRHDTPAGLRGSAVVGREQLYGKPAEDPKRINTMTIFVSNVNTNNFHGINIESGAYVAFERVNRGEWRQFNPAKTEEICAVWHWCDLEILTAEEARHLICAHRSKLREESKRAAEEQRNYTALTDQVLADL